MKLLLVLLACVAVAHGLSYSYYRSHNFYVYPASSCYRYTIYFPRTWCSSSYYSPILKVYPGEDCGKDGWEERDNNDVITEMRNLLNGALSKMTSAMTTKRAEFLAKLCETHREYKDNYVKYITRYYAYLKQCNPGTNYEKEMQGKIAAYCSKLGQMKSDVIKKYNDAIAAKIAAVKEYHEKLIKSATECLETRTKKIAEYKETVSKKIRDYVVKFTKMHLAIAEKKKDTYKATLTSVFGSFNDWWLNFKANIVIYNYEKDQRMEVEKLVRIYTYKLCLHQKKLIDYYTCAYRCYMSNACLRFYKKSYYSHCRSLGTWFQYKTNYCVTRYILGPYQFKILYPTYRGLKTCDVNADATQFAKNIAEMRKKMEEVLKEHTTQFFTWKSKWIGYFVQYKAKYAQYVKERHAWWLEQVKRQYLSCNRGGPLTPAQIAELAKLKRELDAKATEACRKYNDKLSAQITACFNKYLQEQGSYRKMVEDLIKKMEAQFKTCNDKRTVAIAAYKKKLEDAAKEKRISTAKRMADTKNAYLVKYDAMLKSYHGDKYNTGAVAFMTSCYLQALVKSCNAMLDEQDAYWAKMIPLLVQHYACGMRCKVYAWRMPMYTCGTYYRWSYHLPACSIYSYKYSSYRYCF